MRPGSSLWRGLLRRVQAEDRRALLRAFGRPGSGTCEAEFRLRDDDGRVRWISVQGRAMHPAQRASGRMTGVYGDITRRKSAEAQQAMQRDQVARLQRASLLGVLSGAMAHDLMQPLTAVLGNAEAVLTILRRPPRDTEHLPDPRTIEESLLDIRTSCVRMHEIIRNTRAVFERGELSRSRLDVNDCVRSTLNLERGYLQARNTGVDLRLGEALAPVLISEVQLQQVLINLIVNACDAMEKLPESQRRIELATSPCDRGVEIVVRDAGPGLPNTEQIFEPFFTSKPHGIGLGLAICRMIVTGYGGRLWATNRDTGGAELHVMIPIHEPGAESGRV